MTRFAAQQVGLGPAAPGKPIKAKVAALHGAHDPFAPPDEVSAFAEETRRAGVDWQLAAYGNSVHSFTDWNAGDDNWKGSACNEMADKRSWEAMKQFFAEIFLWSRDRQEAEVLRLAVRPAMIHV